ncbi:TraB/GumN family protein [Vibrio salinus]|uniref:TraB/GumN family protein n=1 Tax=Vibrio salinus TaxID=2899784 RepID=UPI001E47544E|nr:TraB/GumN family protein [Vibrio salinus]MCE0494416.1 TraB/GumN family protein [Vibrio salinus]
MSLRNWFTSGFLFFSFFSHATPMYWMAEKKGVEYLLIGTVHVGDKSMYPLPREVTRFLKQSNGLILEADLDAGESPTYPTDSVMTEDVLSDVQKNQLKQIAKKLQLSPYRLSHLPPWSAAITIQITQLNQLGYSAALGVDRHLIALAKKEHIPVYGLETLQSQLDMLTEQNDSGKELLISALDDWKHNKNNLLCMLKSWKSGDEKNLNELVRQTSMSKQLSRALETNRNKNWAKKLTSETFSTKKIRQISCCCRVTASDRQ